MALTRYTALLFVALIYLLLPTLTFSQTFDPDDVFSNDLYKKMVDSPMVKEVKPPPHRQTDTTKTIEDMQLAIYKKQYPNVPSWRILQVMRSCSLLSTCVIPNELDKLQKEAVKLTKRKTVPWYTQLSIFVKQKIVKPISQIFVKFSKALLAFFDRFLFWRKDSSQFVTLFKDKVITPTIALAQKTMDKIAKSAQQAASLLRKPDLSKPLGEEKNIDFYKNSHPRFIYDHPNDPRIPASYRETLYNWGVREWDPVRYPQNYVECVAFVAMVYNDAGISLKGRINGNAIDWKDNTKTFQVYESGKSTVLPQIGDVMVWDKTPENTAGHVGVVSNIIPINKTRLRIYIHQGNSTEKMSVYEYSINPLTKSITIRFTKRGSTRMPPQWWLRLK